MSRLIRSPLIFLLLILAGALPSAANLSGPTSQAIRSDRFELAESFLAAEDPVFMALTSVYELPVPWDGVLLVTVSPALASPVAVRITRERMPRGVPPESLDPAEAQHLLSQTIRPSYGVWSTAFTSGYTHHRFLHPRLGHFLTPDFRAPDIYDPSTFTEPYAYAAGNPIMFWDPDGLDWWMLRGAETSYFWVDFGEEQGIFAELSLFGKIEYVAQTNEEFVQKVFGVRADDFLLKHVTEQPGDIFIDYYLPPSWRPGASKEELWVRQDWEPKGGQAAIPGGVFIENFIGGSMLGKGARAVARKSAFSLARAGGLRGVFRATSEEFWAALYRAEGRAAIGNPVGILVETAEGVVKRLKGSASVPGSVAHKSARWLAYQQRGGKWTYHRWSKVYEACMRNPKVGLGREEVYRRALQGQNRILNTPFGQRQIDVFVPEDSLMVQVKSGYQSLTTTGRHANTWAIQRDNWFVRQGYQVEWILEGGASKQLLKALDDAGITYHLGPILQ